MSYKERRESSLNREMIGILTESSHISNNLPEFEQIYNIEIYSKNMSDEKRNTYTGKGIEWTITSWTDDKTVKDDIGRPLDLIVYNINEKIVREPLVERQIRLSFLEEDPASSLYKWGYYDNKESHKGFAAKNHESNSNLSGYMMWQQAFKIKK